MQDNFNSSQHNVTSPAPQKQNAQVFVLIILVITFIATTAVAYFWQQSVINEKNAKISDLEQQIGEFPKISYMSQKGEQVLVYNPSNNDIIDSPVTVIGQIPGNWADEGDFVISVKDSDGNNIGESIVKIDGDWMTTDLVPFSTILPFSGSGAGTLVLKKDNPSGLSENDDQVILNIEL
ncbi:MAG: Gmad2 immunoglobulin-like domain-containing protein [Candidatus Woesebacteria bacterium]|jgi:hypothetical protein